jgi:hypothetical protein
MTIQEFEKLLTAVAYSLTEKYETTLRFGYLTRLKLALAYYCENSPHAKASRLTQFPIRRFSQTSSLESLGLK